MKLATYSNPALQLEVFEPARQTSTGPRAFRFVALLASLMAFAAAALLPTSARSEDGCLVLLCLAAPSWRNIPQCIDPVGHVLRHLAHGHPFPSCAMSGTGNSASNQATSAPALCPVQYTRAVEVVGGMAYECDYSGVVDVQVDGVLWSRLWWNESGDSVTEFAPSARARLGSWDTHFDDDYARWLATRPPIVLPVGSV